MIQLDSYFSNGWFNHPLDKVAATFLFVVGLHVITSGRPSPVKTSTDGLQEVKQVRFHDVPWTFSKEHVKKVMVCQDSYPHGDKKMVKVCFT